MNPKKLLLRHLPFTWKKGFLMVAYFLLLALVNFVTPSDVPFYVLAWPLYALPKHTFLAGIVQLLFVYAVAVIIETLFWSKKSSHSS